MSPSSNIPAPGAVPPLPVQGQVQGQGQGLPQQVAPAPQMQQVPAPPPPIEIPAGAPDQALPAMQFDLGQVDVNAPDVVPEGPYKLQVVDGQETLTGDESKNPGLRMVVVQFALDGGPYNGFALRDYFVLGSPDDPLCQTPAVTMNRPRSGGKKLAKLCHCAGIGSGRGTIPELLGMLRGHTVGARITVQAAKGGFDESNRIAEYVPAGGMATQPGMQAPPVQYAPPVVMQAVAPAMVGGLPTGVVQPGAAPPVMQAVAPVQQVVQPQQTVQVPAQTVPGTAVVANGTVIPPVPGT